MTYYSKASSEGNILMKQYLDTKARLDGAWNNLG